MSKLTLNQIEDLDLALNGHADRVETLMCTHRYGVGLMPGVMSGLFLDNFMQKSGLPEGMAEWCVNGFLELGWPFDWPLEFASTIEVADYQDRWAFERVSPEDFAEKWTPGWGDFQWVLPDDLRQLIEHLEEVTAD